MGFRKVRFYFISKHFLSILAVLVFIMVVIVYFTHRSANASEQSSKAVIKNCMTTLKETGLEIKNKENSVSQEQSTAVSKMQSTFITC